MKKSDKHSAARQRLVEQMQRRRTGEPADWAFLRIAEQLSQRQESFCLHLAEGDGSCRKGGCGLDFGGPAAFQLIVDSLRKKGVLRLEKDRLVLVLGDPLTLAEAVLDKPYQKVRRERLKLFDGEQLSVTDAQVWLDPRGGVTFHVALHPAVADFFRNDPRLRVVDSALAVSTGDSFKQATEAAVALSLEFFELHNATIEEVILVEYEARDASGYHDTTGLNLAYHQRLLVGGTRLFVRTASGGMVRSHKLANLAGEPGSPERLAQLRKERAAIIPSTPERLAALESLRRRLAAMGREFADIIHSDSFAELLEGGGHALLAHNPAAAAEPEKPARKAGRHEGPIDDDMF